jgi:hypothetical protein
MAAVREREYQVVAERNATLSLVRKVGLVMDAAAVLVRVETERRHQPKASGPWSEYGDPVKI